MAQMNSIFNFLKEYNELTNPVITEIDKQLWSLKLTNLPRIKEVWSIFYVQNNNGELILEVGRPVLEPCPAPDPDIIDWISEKWGNVEKENVFYREKRVLEENLEDGTMVHREEFFEDTPERKKLYDDWIRKRNMWRNFQLPKKQGLDLYNNLFRLYSDIKKESESVELILGDGHIKWGTEHRTLDHPVYLQKVTLEFNSDKPSFLIKSDDAKPEIYSPMLRVISSINQAMLSDVLQEVENNQYHIADTENTKGFFQRLITVVSSQGRLVDTYVSTIKEPVIMSDPVLFLRKRTLGFSNLINEIIKDINETNGNSIPGFFGPMFGDYSSNNYDETIEETWNHSGVDQDVLLTLPANNEQLKIIKYLNNYGAVLVQGPPGTGKTHTIANLIGHLLSEGNSVLVTSHTEKALSVLKAKVYRELQSLCLSLLSSSSERKEMDNALFEIAEKGTTLDLKESLIKIGRLEEERKGLISRLKEKQDELLQIRSLEYKDIVYANQTITPIEAAKFISQGEGILDYIPGPTTDDTIGFPISKDDLAELYQTNAKLYEAEEKILGKGLPALELIWRVEDFNERLSEIMRLEEVMTDWKSQLFETEDVDLDILQKLIYRTEEVLTELKKMNVLKKAVLSMCMMDKIYAEFWVEVFEEFDLLKVNYKKYRYLKFENDINIPSELTTVETLLSLDEIIDSGKDNPVGLLSAFRKPKWKKIRDSISINTKKPEKRMDYQNIREVLDYDVKKTSLLKKINKLFTQIVDQSVQLDNFEEKVEDLKNNILPSFTWHKDHWLQLINELLTLSEGSEKFVQACTIDLENPIESMKNILEFFILPELKGKSDQLRLKNNLEFWNVYHRTLTQLPQYGGPFDGLINAVSKKDFELYSQNYREIVKLYAKVPVFERRSQILKQINEYAPGWAEAIRHRKEIHGGEIVPDNIRLAWKWLQLDSQIKRIDSYDPNLIQSEINKVSELLVKNARTLAYEKAWFNKVKNKTIEQNQAIEGWRQTMRRVGKGTGKMAPELLKKARELMPKCQTAIPVWIMPLNKVAESFDPRNNKFDVVIIDEASQADILALSALYLGKKVIIVGDDEQVSPSVVGLKADEINALIEQHLSGIPNKHLYNDKTSIYDIAKTSGFKPLMLTEHFRCLPEIIRFSNKLSYNERIRPLRDTSGVHIKPAVIEYRVPSATQKNKINTIEAEHIASLIIACTESKKYKNKTIGVISLLGQEQAYEVDRLLQTYLDPKEYEYRKIQCGTPAQFQGDERDVIFLSLVHAPNEQGGPIRLISEDGNNDLTRKRYNVAASRAKDQMWVVHSLNPEIDLKPDDIRLRLIKHAIDPGNNEIEVRLSSTESDFEKKVMNTLINKGYYVISQWQVGAYRIDLVVQDGDKRIAIECDGEKWHTRDDLPNDLKRQAILERLGWRFIRIRGSAYYRNPENTMNWVFEELTKYEIYPNFKIKANIDETNNEDKEDNVLIDRIKHRALRIRKEWHNELAEDAWIEKESQEGNSFDAVKGAEPEVTKNTNLKNYGNDKPNTLKEKINNENKVDSSITHILQKPKFDFRKK